MSLLRPLENKTTSLLRPVLVSPKWYFPYDCVFNIRTTSLKRPLLGSPKGGLNIGILLYIVKIIVVSCQICTLLKSSNSAILVLPSFPNGHSSKKEKWLPYFSYPFILNWNVSQYRKVCTKK